MLSNVVHNYKRKITNITSNIKTYSQELRIMTFEFIIFSAKAMDARNEIILILPIYNSDLA